MKVDSKDGLGNVTAERDGKVDDAILVVQHAKIESETISATKHSM